MVGLLAAVLVQLSPAYMVGEIGERLRGPPLFALSSRKQPHDLELCVADVLSRGTQAAAFRDGPNRSVVTGSLTGALTKVAVAIELNGSATGTQIVARGFGRRRDDKLREYLTRCL